MNKSRSGLVGLALAGVMALSGCGERESKPLDSRIVGDSEFVEWILPAVKPKGEVKFKVSSGCRTWVSWCEYVDSKGDLVTESINDSYKESTRSEITGFGITSMRDTDPIHLSNRAYFTDGGYVIEDEGAFHVLYKGNRKLAEGHTLERLSSDTVRATIGATTKYVKIK